MLRGLLRVWRRFVHNDTGELRTTAPSEPGTKAGGAGAVGIGGSADHARITTVHVHGGEPDKLVWDLAASRSGSDHLPADLPDFQGRAEQIERLKAILTAGGGQAAITAIGGMGGIGKSALALHAAHLLENEAPDGRIFVDLGGTSPRPLTPVDAMAHVVTALVPAAQVPREDNAAAQTYRSALDDKRVLLLLDNAESTAQVKPLLDWRAPTTMVMVTSRRIITAPGLEPLDLEVMTENEARALLRSALCGRDVSASDLDAIAERCGRLPLALRVAGTFLALNPDWSVEEYLEALADEKQRLEALKIEDAELDVFAVLGLSAKKLAEEKPELAARWQLLSVFPASFDQAATAAVWQVEPGAARAELGELRRRSMIFFDDAVRRWRLHDLMRDVAQVPLQSEDAPALEDRLEAARERHARHYCGVLTAAGDLYLKGGDSVLAGLALYDLEQRNITAAQAWSALAAKVDEAAAAPAAAFGESLGATHVLCIRLHPSVWIKWLEAQREACVRLGDRQREGNALGNLGSAWFHLGEPQRAIGFHERALEISREIGNRRAEAQDLGNLGIAWMALGEARRAIEFFEGALEISREIGDRRGEGNALGNVGLAWADLGEMQRAVRFYKQQLAIASEIGDRRGEGNARGNLGIAWAALGEPRRAVEFFEHQLAIARQIGDWGGEGAALGNLGVAWVALGEPRRAIESYKQSLAIAREIGDRRGEGNALGNIGLALDQLGEREAAARRTREALTVFELIGTKHLVEKARVQLAAWGIEEGEQ